MGVIWTDPGPRRRFIPRHDLYRPLRAPRRLHRNALLHLLCLLLLALGMGFVAVVMFRGV